MPFVDSGAARIAYSVAGDGPPVLLLHAGVTDRRSWRPLIEHLGTGFRTIAYDRRGFGETTYEAEPYREMDDALAVLDAEDVESAVVIGASNGGQRAIAMALAHPERVRALVLIGAGVSGAPDEDPTSLAAPVQRLYAAYEAAEEGDDLDELNRVEAHAWLDGWAAEEGRVTGPIRELFLDMNGIAIRRFRSGTRGAAPPGLGHPRQHRASPPSSCAEISMSCPSRSASTSPLRSPAPATRCWSAPGTSRTSKAMPARWR